MPKILGFRFQVPWIQCASTYTQLANILGVVSLTYFLLFIHPDSCLTFEVWLFCFIILMCCSVFIGIFFAGFEMSQKKVLLIWTGGLSIIGSAMTHYYLFRAHKQEEFLLHQLLVCSMISVWSLGCYPFVGRARLHVGPSILLAILFIAAYIVSRFVKTSSQVFLDPEQIKFSYAFFLYWLVFCAPSVYDFCIVLMGKYSTPEIDMDMKQSYGTTEPVKLSGPYSVPSCRLCEDKLYDGFQICPKPKSCGHTVCIKCSDKFHNSIRTAPYGPCPYCKLMVVVDGRESSAWEKEKAMKEIQEAKVQKI